MLETQRGQFPDFAALRGAFIRNSAGAPDVHRFFNVDEWDDSTLHISELGKCARQQMYRLLKTPKKPKAQATIDNDELMFLQANYIHAVTCGALDWAGILISHEKRLNGLPEGWSGHFDALYQDRNTTQYVLWDGKTVRPNAFDYVYDWPKTEVTRQIQGYLHFCLEADHGQVEYIDRGGSNTPRTYTIKHDTMWVDLRMLALDSCRDVLPELPAMLTREYKVTFRKVNNETLHKAVNVWYQPCWQCGWCDYNHEQACQPIMDKMQVAKTEKGKLICLEEEHAQSLKKFLETAVLEWTEE